MAKKEHGMRAGEGSEHGMGMHTPDPGGHAGLQAKADASVTKGAALIHAVHTAKQSRVKARPMP